MTKKVNMEIIYMTIGRSNHDRLPTRTVPVK